ncbi:hypothetical protein [Rhizobium sp. IMFF44]|uniref:hypothetical protein n=1 Tax=Rhizobium sp. IMFF44 TaxID=3342350 RepID=UPI0035B771AA
MTKDFTKTVRVAPSTSNCNTAGEIKLATINADKYVNLITSERTLTITPTEAKQLRDLLIEAYPLDTAKPAKFRVGDVVIYRAIAGYGIRNMDGRKGTIVNVKLNGWYEVNFGTLLGSLVPVHEDYIAAAPIEQRKIQVGDRVRRIAGSRKGELMTVTYINGGDIKVAEMSGIRMTSYFELVTEAPAKEEATSGRFIVVALEGANYAPSSKPHVHLSAITANQEAQRLAKEVGGTFHVLRATFEASREKPVIPPVKTAKL